MGEPPVRILFVCTGNSARSQLAEALLRHLSGPEVEVLSAGTAPKGVNRLTLAVLAEAGVETSGLRSKSVAEVVDQRFDRVVTVCDDARESCPVIPGARSVDHWSLTDPAAVEGTDDQRLAAFRATRDEIRERLAGFLDRVEAR